MKLWLPIGIELLVLCWSKLVPFIYTCNILCIGGGDETVAAHRNRTLGAMLEQAGALHLYL